MSASWYVSYRAPSNPGLEKPDTHVPPIRLSKNPYAHSQHLSHTHVQPLITKNVTTEPWMNDETVNNNQCKESLANMYDEKVKQKWYDGQNNLHKWEYDPYGENDNHFDQFLNTMTK